MISFTVRVPAGLNTWLNRQATASNQSKNGLVISLLEAARATHACKDGYHYKGNGDTCICGRYVFVERR